MNLPPNRFKQGLAGDRVQYGLWVSLADPVAAAVLDLRPVGTQPLALQARAVGDQIQVKKVP